MFTGGACRVCAPAWRCMQHIAGHDAENQSGSSRKQQRRTNGNADLRCSGWCMAIVLEGALGRGKSKAQVICRGQA